MQEFDETLGRYTVTDNEDGTKNIEGVPIFQVGFERNGKVYDDAWADKAIQTHNEMKEADGYVPPVFIGHTKDDEEKPATGHFDNLRKVGANLLADLIRVPSKIYGEIKGGMWPSRSIEALHTQNDSRVLGLALLGSSTPACKFGPLQFNEMQFKGNTEDVDRIDFVDKFHDAVAGGLTFDQLSGKIRDKVSEQVEQNSNNQNSTGVLECSNVWVKTIFVEQPIAIVEFDEDLFSVTYQIGQDNSVSVTDMIKVEEQYVPILVAQFSDSEVDDKKLKQFKEDVMTEAEKKAADEKVIADKAIADKLAEDKAKADKLAEEKAKADKEAADKLKAKIDANDSDKMAEELKSLKEEMAELKATNVKTSETAVEADVDAFIETRNSKGVLPKSLIQFKGDEAGLALRETLLKASPEVREDIKAFVDAMAPAVSFKDVAPNGDEEEKELAGSPDKLAEKFAKLSEAMADEKKIDIKDAQNIVMNENPDIKKHVEATYGI